MKFGFFFGAGAECSYGLPTGGQFAVDLFRTSPTTQKEKLRDVLKNINKLTTYATEWLPDSFDNKKIHVFGRSEFTSLIESSIEYRKEKITQMINSFDNLVVNALNKVNTQENTVKQKFFDKKNVNIGDIRYSQEIQINPLLSDGNFSLFNSEYYSAILHLLRDDNPNTELSKYASAFLQLLVACYGQKLTQKLNQEIFSRAPDDISIFDDVTGLFRLDFSKGGLSALEMLLGERRRIELDENSSIEDIFIALSQQILENLFADVLDYQALIDSHFRYLFSPKTEWAKFTKMVVFLHLVRDYIIQKGNITDEILLDKDGYYHDIANYSNTNLEISVIGTSNYNNFVERVFTLLGMDIPSTYHLNGGINDFYDPYKNKTVVVEGEVPNNYIYVPFLFTQSGLKPLTSVSMSKRYVDLYEKYKSSEAIVVVGYGFNIDDGHINGVFRELIEEDNKKVFVVVPETDGSELDISKKIQRKLRITQNRNNLKIIRVNVQNRCKENSNWLDAIIKELNSN